MADDARIAEQAVNVLVAEARDLAEVEAGEGLPEILALPQNRQPRQAGLEALEADLLEETHVVGDRTTPFAVVVGHVVLGAGVPGATLPAVRPDDQPALGHPKSPPRTALWHESGRHESRRHERS